MPAYVYWFLMGIVLLSLEMTTGTFYLLISAVAFAVGGLVALLGWSMPLQFLFSALAGVAGILFLRRRQAAQPADNNSLDIGQTVKILSWRSENSARVFYRGTEWDAELAHTGVARDGVFYIQSMRGSTLILTQHKPK